MIFEHPKNINISLSVFISLSISLLHGVIIYINNLFLIFSYLSQRVYIRRNIQIYLSHIKRFNMISGWIIRSV